MQKKTVKYFFLILILADLSYSFAQHLSMPLDGDMAGGIVPNNEVEQIFNDPFGVSVLTKGEIYPNPNRYFAHGVFYLYFTYCPLILQKFVNPIESVYLSCAIAKICIQIGFILLFSFYITGSRRIFNGEFLLAAFLVTPLFQTNGYRSYLGIIDSSTTYTFFYALPCSILLLIFMPFYRNYFYNTPFTSNKFILLFLILSTVFITLNGPLIPGIVLIVSILLIAQKIIFSYSENPDLTFGKRLLHVFIEFPRFQLLFFGLICFFSLYSLFIGLNNSIFLYNTIPVSHRYFRIPIGIYFLLTQKIGFPILILMISINVFLIRKYFKNEEGRKILTIFRWIGVFSFFYILLLPLGGYKNYRPNIIRYDTIMPITIVLIIVYGLSSHFLIRTLIGNKRYLYLTLVLIFSFIFTIADKADFGKNNCEKIAMHDIAESNEIVVRINSDCNLLSWGKIASPLESDLNGQLLKKWRVIKEKKLYFQE